MSIMTANTLATRYGLQWNRAALVPPDESGRLRATGGWMSRTAAHLRSIGAAVDAGGVVGWHGVAATSFVESLDRVGPVCSQTADWLDDCAAVAGAYAFTLAASTASIDQLQRILASRQSDCSGDAAGPTAVPLAIDAVAIGLVAQLDAELDTLLAAHDRLVRQWTSEPAGLDPHRSAWSKIGHWLQHAADPVSAFIEHPSLATFSAACGAVVNDLSGVAMGLEFVCPPAAVVVWGVVAVAAAAKLLTDTDRALHGERAVGWKSLAGDGLAAIPVGGARLKQAVHLGNPASTEQIELLTKNIEHFGDVIKSGRTDVSLIAPGGGMAQHEVWDNGHTLYNHEAADDASIWARRALEPKLKGVSAYPNRSAIEEGVTSAIHAERNEVMQFLTSSEIRVVIRHTAESPLGRVHMRGATDVVPASTIVVVLKKHPESPVGFRIVTSFLDP
ncbi:MAG: hypothetical protein JWN95_732 [Frankiales bacterium]|nr:hypothetical protein [Frankiales bacterium]